MCLNCLCVWPLAIYINIKALSGSEYYISDINFPFKWSKWKRNNILMNGVKSNIWIYLSRNWMFLSIGYFMEENVLSLLRIIIKWRCFKYLFFTKLICWKSRSRPLAQANLPTKYAPLEKPFAWTLSPVTRYFSRTPKNNIIVIYL